MRAVLALDATVLDTNLLMEKLKNIPIGKLGSLFLFSGLYLIVSYYQQNSVLLF